MILKYLSLGFLSVILFACSNTDESKETTIEVIENNEIIQPENKIEVEIIDNEKSNNISSEIAGFYVGDFEATEYKRTKNPSIVNKITISIDSIKDSLVFGHSIVAGNSRPFKGNVKDENNAPNELTFNVKEPGDDKYDGVFSFFLDIKENKIKGDWIAYNKNLAVTKRHYVLEKKEFKYNPNIELPRDMEWEQLYHGENFDEEVGEWESTTDEVTKFNPSVKLLTKDDVENMYQGDLEVMRNSIYARHGYSFKHRRMRYVFDKIDWYIPVYDDVRNFLTEVEKKNIELIKRYEKHAEAYYDSYGR